MPIDRLISIFHLLSAIFIIRITFVVCARENQPANVPDFMLLRKLLALQRLSNRNLDTTETPTSATTSTSNTSPTTTVSDQIPVKSLAEEIEPLIKEFYHFIRLNKTLEEQAKSLFGRVLPHVVNLWQSNQPNIVVQPNDLSSIKKMLDPLLRQSKLGDEINISSDKPNFGEGLNNTNGSTRYGRSGWGGGCCGGCGGGGVQYIPIPQAAATSDLNALLPLLFGLIALLIAKLPT